MRVKMDVSRNNKMHFVYKSLYDILGRSEVYR